MLDAVEEMNDIMDHAPLIIMRVCTIFSVYHKSTNLEGVRVMAIIVIRYKMPSKDIEQ